MLWECQPKAFSRWHNNYNNIHGRVDPPSALHGRHHILTGDVIGELRKLMQESPELYLDDIQISTTALHDNLRDLGISSKIMILAAAQRDDQLRAEWMYDFLETYVW